MHNERYFKIKIQLKLKIKSQFWTFTSITKHIVVILSIIFTSISEFSCVTFGGPRDWGYSALT